MKHFHKKRLLKLAEFLEKLPRKKFDFGNVVEGEDIPNKTLSCGSVACAIGWCPVVFPDLAKYKRQAYVGGDYIDVLTLDERGQTDDGYIDAGVNLFGLTHDESYSMFTPHGWESEEIRQIGVKPLVATATPKQVASNIRRFLKYKEKNP